MPIYEFKCLACDEFFEVIVMNASDENLEGCPKCGAKEFERVVSRTNYTMGSSSGGTSSRGRSAGVQTQERVCSGGSCKTYTVPGETR